MASHPALFILRNLFTRLPYAGATSTLKRRLNLYLSRLEVALGRTRLWSNPVKLTIEAANVCNLRCTACFTGLGEDNGRAASTMSLPLYRKLLDEIGDTLYELEFHNWGEPLLAKQIYTMIEEAAARGISTSISTNLSIPFDAERAERLVRSKLTVLGVSIDGARQQSYEQYRVKGNLELVLRNCRLIADAKRRLGSTTPRFIWEYHVFEHNEGDVELAKSLARELDMEIYVSKGWVTGPEWKPAGPWRFYNQPRAFRCLFLWHYAVVNSDGGVAPCCGTFHREDDMGRVAVAGDGVGATTFREVWNGPRFRAARALYRSRSGPPAVRDTICFDCPVTVTWERFRAHRAARRPSASFVPDYTDNDTWNYFWSRRPRRDANPAP
jgi:organic radical activating enzyme